MTFCKWLLLSISLPVFAAGWDGAVFGGPDQGKIVKWRANGSHIQAFRPSQVKTAICDAKPFPVRMTGKETKKVKCEEDVCGMPGLTLEITGPTESECLLASPELLSQFEFFAFLPAKKKDCGTALQKSLSALGGRTITQCTLEKTFPGGGQVGFVVFEYRTTGLAGIFLGRNDSPGLLKFETTPSYGWRVGDNKKFSSEDISLVWGLKRKQDGALGLHYVWYGGEGINTRVALAEGKSLSDVFEHYQYAAGK